VANISWFRLVRIRSLVVIFVLFVAKKFDHTTKYTKSTKVIYFILFFLRDLRGKNKTE